MNEKDNVTKAKAVDSLLNFETVSICVLLLFAISFFHNGMSFFHNGISFFHNGISYSIMVFKPG